MRASYSAVLPDTGAAGGSTYAAGFGTEDARFVTPRFDAESGEPLARLLEGGGRLGRRRRDHGADPASTARRSTPVRT